MQLSIGMIVKNEEKYLDRCLAAIKPILDSINSELIIAIPALRTAPLR